MSYHVGQLPSFQRRSKHCAVVFGSSLVIHLFVDLNVDLQTEIRCSYSSFSKKPCLLTLHLTVALLHYIRPLYIRLCYHSWTFTCNAMMQNYGQFSNNQSGRMGPAPRILLIFRGHSEVNISNGSGIWDPQFEVRKSKLWELSVGFVDSSFLGSEISTATLYDLWEQQTIKRRGWCGFNNCGAKHLK